MFLRFVRRVCREWGWLMFLAGYLRLNRLTHDGLNRLTKKSCSLAPKGLDNAANVLQAYPEVVADLPGRPSRTPIQMDDSAPQPPLHWTKSNSAGKDVKKKGAAGIFVPCPPQI